ncbi:hypothetical protein NDA01_14415 [Trichocoleus desertorum AS-A10]|uniref:hypothetical protein n=1 Tax=Trichocoleus desertorum TaxID=1481672 RepID=UPI0032968BB5
MGTNLGFVVKVMMISALVAIAIRFVGRTLVVQATPETVLFVVLFPSFALAMALGWRAWQQRSLS